MPLKPIAALIGFAQVALTVNPGAAQAQDTTNLNALPIDARNGVYGLAPLGAIPTPYTSTNFWVVLAKQTNGIINGTINFPYNLLLHSTSPSSPSMQTQAIPDAPYTRPNLDQLADGYGTRLDCLAMVGSMAGVSSSSWSVPRCAMANRSIPRRGWVR